MTTFVTMEGRWAHPPSAPLSPGARRKSSRKSLRHRRPVVNSTNTDCSGAAPTPSAAVCGQRMLTTSETVWVVRVAFLVCLALVGVGLSVAAFIILRNAEHEDLAEVEYDSLADRALREATSFMTNFKLGAQSMASMVGFLAPNASRWPLIFVDGFEPLARYRSETNGGFFISLLPFVSVDEKTEFERHAYHYYFNVSNYSRKSVYPNGIWAADESITNGGRRMVSIGHPNPISAKSTNRTTFAPILQYSTATEGPLLLDAFASGRRNAVDDVLKCAERRKLEQNKSRACAFFSEPISVVESMEVGPSSVVYEPIYPANDPWTVSH